MQNFLIISLSILLMSYNGCKTPQHDNTDQEQNITLPAYSETGANTFGCLHDGKIFTVFGLTKEVKLLTNYVDNIVTAGTYQVYGTTDTAFTISGSLGIIQNNEQIRSEGMSITIIKKGSLKGTHILPGSTFNDYMAFGDDLNPGMAGEYSCSSRNPISIIIKKDVINGKSHIISGTFEGYLYNFYKNPAKPDSIHITQGVFDVDLSTAKAP